MKDSKKLDLLEKRYQQISEELNYYKEQVLNFHGEPDEEQEAHELVEELESIKNQWMDSVKQLEEFKNQYLQLMDVMREVIIELKSIRHKLSWIERIKYKIKKKK